jgi:hypothetical protein
MLVAKHANRGHKIITGIGALILSAGAIIGVGYAFFSDSITDGGSATAGTLVIEGASLTISHNGIILSGSNTVTNFNPGDIIGIRPTGTITNTGSQSAWIREVIEISAISDTDNTGVGGADANTGSLAGWLYACRATANGGSDAVTVGFFRALFTNWPRDANGVLINVDGAPLGGPGWNCWSATASTNYTYSASADNQVAESQLYTPARNVIDGAGPNGEDDNGTLGLQNTRLAGFNINSAPGTNFKLYFDALAPNAAQNGTVTFEYKVQALQYRNNDVTMNPNGPSPSQWSTVVSIPFGIQ